MRPRERAGSEACRSSPRRGAYRRRSGRQVLGRAQCGDDGGARGRHELAGDWCGREGDIARLAQVDDSGDGNGHEAVGAANGAVALGKRLDHDVLNTQVIEADGDGADVDDGVDGAHLVGHDQQLTVSGVLP